MSQCKNTVHTTRDGQIPQRSGRTNGGRTRRTRDDDDNESGLPAPRTIDRHGGAPSWSDTLATLATAVGRGRFWWCDFVRVFLMTGERRRCSRSREWRGRVVFVRQHSHTLTHTRTAHTRDTDTTRRTAQLNNTLYTSAQVHASTCKCFYLTHSHTRTHRSAHAPRTITTTCQISSRALSSSALQWLQRYSVAKHLDQG